MTVQTKKCQNCGAGVLDDFARVFGDNENRVHLCPECSPSMKLIFNGAAAVPSSKAPEPPTGDAWSD